MNPVIEAPTRLPTFFSERLWIMALGLVLFVLFETWLRADAAGHLSKLLRVRRPKREPDTLIEPDWDVLYERAESVVSDTIAALPDDVKTEATKLPCLFRKRAQELHGGEALGIYKGFQPGLISEQGGPIVLFVGDIYRYCTDNALDFDQEVTTTYLHELGHHLGWGEEELQNRGLA